MRTRTVAWLLALGLSVAGCSERPPIVGAEPAESRGARNVVVQGRASATSPPRVASFDARVEVWAEQPDAALREAEFVARRLRGQLQNAGVRGTDLVDLDRGVTAMRQQQAPHWVATLASGDPGGAASGASEAQSESDVAADEDRGPFAARRKHDDPMANGFLAVEAFSVTVRDQASLGKVLDRALAFGATWLGPVVWMPNNPDVLIEKVRQKAVQDARARAQVLAQELGQAVGQANSIHEIELVEPGDDPARPYEARCEVRIDFTLRSF